MDSQARRPKARGLVGEKVGLSVAELAVLTGTSALTIRRNFESCEHEKTCAEYTSLWPSPVAGTSSGLTRNKRKWDLLTRIATSEATAAPKGKRENLVLDARRTTFAWLERGGDGSA
jgi:DeoR/GlpR family transcriptional regulator of sugar metabolism